MVSSEPELELPNPAMVRPMSASSAPLQPGAVASTSWKTIPVAGVGSVGPTLPLLNRNRGVARSSAPSALISVTAALMAERQGSVAGVFDSRPGPQ